jgi:paraquat-inducible protein A
MYETGSWPIALVIFFASMVIPLGKMILLIYLVLAAKWGRNPLVLTRLFRAVESLGRWSMLDIFLLAVLVAIMKLGPWTSVRPEIGSLLFTLVVIFTTLASANFEPSLLWEESNAKSDFAKI